KPPKVVRRSCEAARADLIFQPSLPCQPRELRLASHRRLSAVAAKQRRRTSYSNLRSPCQPRELRLASQAKVVRPKLTLLSRRYFERFLLTKEALMSIRIAAVFAASLVISLAAAPPAWAQSEAACKSYFEGRRVT